MPDKFKDADCLFDLGTNNDQVYALSSMIGIPLIKVTSIISYVPYNLTLSMMPSPKTIAEALFKLTMYFGFEDVAIAYDGEYVTTRSHLSSSFCPVFPVFPQFIRGAKKLSCVNVSAQFPHLICRRHLDLNLKQK